LELPPVCKRGRDQRDTSSQNRNVLLPSRLPLCDSTGIESTFAYPALLVLFDPGHRAGLGGQARFRA
jgi:hypothetical protein